MLKKTLMYLSLTTVLIAVSSGFARNILEKKMTYLDNTGKTGQARFWVIFLGNYDLKLSRKFPGESEQQVDASMNLQLLSSGYVEGNGYSAKGKMDCRPVLNINSSSGTRQIDLDSIDFIYDYGSKVALIGGETGDLILDIEGDKQPAKKFLMREYKLTKYYGEEILKEGSTEIQLAAFALTQDGITRAQKAQAALETK
jgi:hypothetical protein